MDISVAMIVRDEADTLAGTLDCAKQFSDDIHIAVDQRSVDGSLEIARRYTQNVYEVDWKNTIHLDGLPKGIAFDFSAARNWVKDKCKHDWVMILDGHETFDQESIDFIKGIGDKLKMPTGEDAEATFFRVQMLDEPGQREGLQPRLFRKRFSYTRPVHNQLVIDTPHIMAFQNVTLLHNRSSVSRDSRKEQRSVMVREGYSALGVNPDDPHVLFYQGIEYANLGEYKKSISCLKEYVRRSVVDSEKVDAMCRIAAAYMASADDKTDKSYETKLAKAWLYRAIQYRGEYAEAYLILGTILLNEARASKDEYLLKRAIHIVKSATMLEFNISPIFTDASYYTWRPWLLLVDLYTTQGDLLKAIDCCLKVLEFKPNANLVDMMNHRYDFLCTKLREAIVGQHFNGISKPVVYILDPDDTAFSNALAQSLQSAVHVVRATDVRPEFLLASSVVWTDEYGALPALYSMLKRPFKVITRFDQRNLLESKVDGFVTAPKEDNSVAVCRESILRALNGSSIVDDTIRELTGANA